MPDIGEIVINQMVEDEMDFSVKEPVSRTSSPTKTN